MCVFYLSSVNVTVYKPMIPSKERYNDLRYNDTMSTWEFSSLLGCQRWNTFSVADVFGLVFVLSYQQSRGFGYEGKWPSSYCYALPPAAAWVFSAPIVRLLQFQENLTVSQPGSRQPLRLELLALLQFCSVAMSVLWESNDTIFANWPAYNKRHIICFL